MKELKNKVALRELYDLDDDKGVFFPENDAEFKAEKQKYMKLDEKLFNTLSKEQYSLFEECMSAHYSAENIEMFYVYMAGFSRCLQLFKESEYFRGNLPDMGDF